MYHSYNKALFVGIAEKVVHNQHRQTKSGIPWPFTEHVCVCLVSTGVPNEPPGENQFWQ